MPQVPNILLVTCKDARADKRDRQERDAIFLFSFFDEVLKDT